MAEPEPDVELPRAVALAWGVAANPQRGPKRELSIERIVEVAMELADHGGLAAVSMASVASELGFTPMSLYRYVTAKDDLVLLMQEGGIGVPPETVREASGWREGLEVWAREMAGVYRRHPWLLDIPVTGAPVTPNNLAWLEAALEVLEPLPFTLDQKVSTVLAVLAQGRWEGGVPALGRDDDAILAQLLTPTEFPHVHAAYLAGAFGSPDDTDPFVFGRDRVFDGIVALLDGRGLVSVPPARDPLGERAAADPKVKEAAKARREAEKALREARKREREQLRNARERLEKRGG